MAALGRPFSSTNSSYCLSEIGDDESLRRSEGAVPGPTPCCPRLLRDPPPPPPPNGREARVDPGGGTGTLQRPETSSSTCTSAEGKGA